MQTKQFFYLAGLPRTASTVLGEILNQNDNIHVSPASPLSEIVSEVFAKWRMNTVTLKAYQHPEQLPNVWRGIRAGMYQHRSEPCIVDKSWAWHMNDAIDATRKRAMEKLGVATIAEMVQLAMKLRATP